MSKEQNRRKYQNKQKRKKNKELSTDDKIKNFVEPIAKSKGAASAFKKALEKTINGK